VFSQIRSENACSCRHEGTCVLADTIGERVFSQIRSGSATKEERVISQIRSGSATKEERVFSQIRSGNVCSRRYDWRPCVLADTIGER